MLTEKINFLQRHMLSCKDVTHLASDYLEKSANGKLHWKIRLHLLACKCCRRFIRHLKITQQIAPQLITRAEDETTIDVNFILHQIKGRTNISKE